MMHDLIMYVYSETSDQPCKEEKEKCLNALKNKPPHYVLYHQKELDNDIWARIAVVERIFKCNRSRNFSNPSLVNSAWRAEQERRKPLKLTPLSDKRKVVIFKEVVASIKKAVAKCLL